MKKIIKKIIAGVTGLFLVLFGILLFCINIMLKNWDLERFIDKVMNAVFRLDEWSEK